MFVTKKFLNLIHMLVRCCAQTYVQVCVCIYRDIYMHIYMAYVHMCAHTYKYKYISTYVFMSLIDSNGVLSHRCLENRLP